MSVASFPKPKPEEPPVEDFLAEALARIAGLRRQRVAAYQAALAEAMRLGGEIADPRNDYHPGVADLARHHGEATRKTAQGIEALVERLSGSGR